MKILIAITTGRPNFKDTLNLIADNIKQFGHFEQNTIDIAINYDCSYLNISKDIFSYNTKRSSLFDKKIYIGEKNIKGYVDFMTSRGIDKEIAKILSQSAGYSNKKNLVLVEAIRNNYDIVLFLDDDEYPFICLKIKNGLLWQQTDILGSHITAYKNYGADVAFGFFTGYASPIPLNLKRRMSSKTARLLGDALSLASDVIVSDTFMNSDIIFKGTEKNNFEIKEIEMVNGGKWISGGNLSVNISAVRKNIIPPYFTPPNSRADDTILSMKLQKAKVIQVPAGIFHDAFFEYTSIVNYNFPNNIIDNNEVSANQIQRFANVLRGWLGYAPIFLRIKYGGGYKTKMDSMLKKLKQTEKYFSKDFPEIDRKYKGQRLSDILNEFDSCTKHQFELMNECYREWKKIL